MEISGNLGFMYEQTFKKFLEYVQIAAGIHPKSQNLFRLCIRPQKKPKFVQTGQSDIKKTPKFVQTGQSGLKKHQFCSDWADFAQIDSK
jgi:hypothetical protein